MREIKFRLYNLRTYEFEYFTLESLLTQDQVLTNDICRYSKSRDQYTGLKDKNSKEIYEGDIVKTYWQHCGVTCYDYEVSGEVKFETHLTSFIINTEKNGNEWNYPFYSFEREELDEETGIKIIGNIHENPELLETKT